MAASLKIALANIVLGAACLLWVAALLTRRQLAWRGAAVLGIPVLFYALVSVISAFLSTDRATSLSELSGLPTLLLVPMTLTLLDRSLWDRLMRALAVVASLSALVGLWQYLGGADDLHQRIHGLAGHYMTFAGWTLLVVLLLLGQMIHARGRDRRRLIWDVPALLVCTVALLLSLTRGVWIGLMVGLVAAVVIRRSVPLVLASVVVVALMLVLQVQPIRDRALSIVDLQDPSTLDRLHMVETGVGMVREHPLFGVGPGMVKPLYASYAPSDAVRTRPPHLHNNIVHLAAERGLAGLVAYLTILGAFVAFSWRLLASCDAERGAPIAGCLVAVIGLSVAGLFEYNWGDAEIWIPTLVCLSTPFALAREGMS